MDFNDIVNRQPHPEPWLEGEKIPWNEPQFSQRMLKEHLTQDHDLASRRTMRIEKQVEWIHSFVLGKKPGRILDLGCGPGFYAQRLCQIGHQVSGIDFSPASIGFAREHAAQANLQVDYLEADIRGANFGDNFDLVMMIYGEFNTFAPDEAALILSKAFSALKPGGKLLLEPHTFDVIKRIGEEPAYWYSSQSGLFSDQPHILLGDNCWDENTKTATQRFYIIDAASGKVTRHASSMQSYTEEGYSKLVMAQGFHQPAFFPSLVGEFDQSSNELIALVAIK